MRRPAVLVVTTGGVLAALLIAGCTSSGGGASSGGNASSDSIATSAPGAVVPEPAAVDSAGSSTGGGSTGDGTGGSSDSGGSAADTSAKLVADSRAVIRTAQITVGVTDAAAVTTQANKAEALVTARGGEVFGDDRNDGSGQDMPARARDATATLTLKVPPAQLPATLTALSQLGTEQSRSLTSQDVTTQVADVSARLASAAASIARLRTLYASATTVTNVIAIEDELSQREADLESLQAQQRALSSETAMATVTLVLTTVTPPAPPRHHHYRGIGGAFANGWHHFGSAAQWLVTALAAVLPFAVLLALIVAAGLWARRRRPAAHPTPASAVE